MQNEILVPCPLCGVDSGYLLDEGSTYRYWSVQCANCRQEVAEARATHPAETTPRTASADAAWQEAGAHAAGLRAEIERLRFEISRAADGIERQVAVADSRVAAERERCAVTWEKLAAAAVPGERIDDTLRRCGNVIRGA